MADKIELYFERTAEGDVKFSNLLNGSSVADGDGTFIKGFKLENGHVVPPQFPLTASISVLGADGKVHQIAFDFNDADGMTQGEITAAIQASAKSQGFDVTGLAIAYRGEGSVEAVPASKITEVKFEAITGGTPGIKITMTDDKGVSKDGGSYTDGVSLSGGKMMPPKGREDYRIALGNGIPDLDIPKEGIAVEDVTKLLAEKGFKAKFDGPGTKVPALEFSLAIEGGVLGVRATYMDDAGNKTPTFLAGYGLNKDGNIIPPTTTPPTESFSITGIANPINITAAGLKPEEIETATQIKTSFDPASEKLGLYFREVGKDLYVAIRDAAGKDIGEIKFSESEFKGKNHEARIAGKTDINLEDYVQLISQWNGKANVDVYMNDGKGKDIRHFVTREDYEEAKVLKETELKKAEEALSAAKKPGVVASEGAYKKEEDAVKAAKEALKGADEDLSDYDKRSTKKGTLRKVGETAGIVVGAVPYALYKGADAALDFVTGGPEKHNGSYTSGTERAVDRLTVSYRTGDQQSINFINTASARAMFQMRMAAAYQEETVGDPAFGRNFSEAVNLFIASSRAGAQLSLASHAKNSAAIDSIGALNESKKPNYSAEAYAFLQSAGLRSQELVEIRNGNVDLDNVLKTAGLQENKIGDFKKALQEQAAKHLAERQEAFEDPKKAGSANKFPFGKEDDYVLIDYPAGDLDQFTTSKDKKIHYRGLSIEGDELKADKNNKVSVGSVARSFLSLPLKVAEKAGKVLLYGAPGLGLNFGPGGKQWYQVEEGTYTDAPGLLGSAKVSLDQAKNVSSLLAQGLSADDVGAAVQAAQRTVGLRDHQTAMDPIGNAVDPERWNELKKNNQAYGEFRNMLGEAISNNPNNILMAILEVIAHFIGGGIFSNRRDYVQERQNGQDAEPLFAAVKPSADGKSAVVLDRGKLTNVRLTETDVTDGDGEVVGKKKTFYVVDKTKPVTLTGANGGQEVELFGPNEASMLTENAVSDRIFQKTGTKYQGAKLRYAKQNAEASDTRELADPGVNPSTSPIPENDARVVTNPNGSDKIDITITTASGATTKTLENLSIKNGQLFTTDGDKDYVKIGNTVIVIYPESDVANKASSATEGQLRAAIDAALLENPSAIPEIERSSASNLGNTAKTALDFLKEKLGGDATKITNALAGGNVYLHSANNTVEVQR